MPRNDSNSAIDPSRYRTAIVLQGGGALGAYEFGVLKALYDQRPGFQPAVVAGISIGAITAAVLGGAPSDPIASLERLWRDKLTVTPHVPGIPGLPIPFLPRSIDQSLATLGNPGMYRLNPELIRAPWAATSIYDTSPLRQTLAELIDMHQLNHGGIRVIVGAIDISTALISYFDNANHDMAFDSVVASGSLPPGFPMTEIEGHHYWDGGLFTNTPFSPAINFLESCSPDDPDIYRELIVVELFPMNAPTPQTLSDVINRMLQLQYTSRIKLDKKLSNTIGTWMELFQEIDTVLDAVPATPKIRALRAKKEYKELMGHRKIAIKVIPANLDHDLTNASDFSRSSIDGRIDAGYDDAKRSGVGW
ncbi:MAG: patatin-like phospholipase family protein [Actinomycetota bacterium]|nr:patatin-like phospholipase family protein [Actinomycetota bacterium]MDQ6946235.1 patatin-like phospholipase family protein [Actinomycetota bacterium]